MDIVSSLSENGNSENVSGKKKSKKKANDDTSSCTTKISNNPDPEKKKSPSKRSSIIKMKRKPKAQGYYRRRLEYFEHKQNGTKEDVVAFLETANDGLEMVSKVMEGDVHVKFLFPLYKAAVSKYQEASLKIRQTLLTERKLAAEVWGDNSIASYDNGCYTIEKSAIEELLAPRSDDVSTARISAAPSVKASSNATKKQKTVAKTQPEPEFDFKEFMDFDWLPITRSRTRKANGQEEDPSPDSPLEPSNKKPSAPKRKEKSILCPPSPVPAAKKSRVASADLRPPSPPPPSAIPETTSKSKGKSKARDPKMPDFKHIDENKISKSVQHYIRDIPVANCICKAEKNGKGCYNDCINRVLHMECGSRCFLKDNCQNKRFQKLQYSSFEPFFTGCKGWGIRAAAPIRRGDFIVEYVGEVVDAEEVVKRVNKYKLNGYKHHYMMSLRNGAVIDATRYGNYSRFVNHSCDPNAETQKWIVNKEIRIGFFAKKDISIGEEIVFDYAFERFGKDAQECYCGSTNCSGFIGGKPEEGDEEESDVDDDNDDDISEDEGQKSSTLTKKVPKPKLTQAEKDYRAKVASIRKKLIKCRAELRKVIGRKKKYTKEDVVAFNQCIVKIEDYETRFVFVDYLNTVPDDQWKLWFIENYGLEILYTWLSDYSLGQTIKRVVRLQGEILRFINTIPFENNEHVTDKILRYLQERMSIQLPDDFVLMELLNEMVDKVVTDEPVYEDKHLSRILECDGFSILNAHDDAVNLAKKLYDRMITLPSKIDEAAVHDDNDSIDNIDNNIEITDNINPVIESSSTRSQSPIESRYRSDCNHTLPTSRERSHSTSPLNHHKENEHRHRNHYDNSKYRRRYHSRSRSRSPINFGSFLSKNVPREYNDFRNRYQRRGNLHHHHHHSPFNKNYHQNEKRYDHQKTWHSRDYHHRRHYDREYSYKRERHHHHHYNNDHERRYSDRYRHEDHYNRSNSYHRYRRRSRSRSRSPLRRDYYVNHDRSRRYSLSPEIRRKASLSKKESFSKEASNSLNKPLKIELPETSPLINKSESPPELPVVKSNELHEESTKLNQFSIENVFPDAPKPVPSPIKTIPLGFGTSLSASFLTDVSTLALPTNINTTHLLNTTGSGPKFRETMKFGGYALPLRNRIPIRIGPLYGIPSSSSITSNTSHGFPLPPTYIPPPPPDDIDVKVDNQKSISNESASEILYDYSQPIKEVKVEEDSLAVSDSIHCKSSPLQSEKEPISKSLKYYSKNPEWVETYTEDGIVYYYHSKTRETRWEEPPEIEQISSSSPPPPPPPPLKKSSMTIALNDGALVEKRNDSSSISAENIDDIKKEFKLNIWRHIYGYIKKHEDVEHISLDVITQFARKMTHMTLENELKNGNKELKITDQVYANAKRHASANLPVLIKSNPKATN